MDENLPNSLLVCGLRFYFYMMSSEEQKFLILLKLNLPIFAFMVKVFVSCLKISQIFACLSVTFSSRIFTFRYDGLHSPMDFLTSLSTGPLSLSPDAKHSGAHHLLPNTPQQMGARSFFLSELRLVGKVRREMLAGH
jgi:hypothetical protein